MGKVIDEMSKGYQTEESVRASGHTELDQHCVGYTAPGVKDRETASGGRLFRSLLPPLVSALSSSESMAGAYTECSHAHPRSLYVYAYARARWGSDIAFCSS